nr:coiled-coil domain-containing protein 115 isoform X1 [Ipomoea batatas]
MPAMADETETKISDDGEEGIVEKDAKVLNFLDSLDSYLILMDTLSSTLRQGCLELASARLSMGASRINSSLLDLKPHSAATTLEIDRLEGSRMEQVHFRLCKWASSASSQTSPKEGKFDEDELLHRKSYNPESTHHGDDSEAQGKKQENNGSQRAVDDQAQRERRKKLSMFGMLVSPKLRSAQLSYETALDTIIEIANMRTSLLHAYNQVAEDMKTTPND